MNSEDSLDKKGMEKTIVDKKKSRTIVISPNSEYNPENLEGITNIVLSSKKAKFITFNTSDDAKKALKTLKNQNVKCKYCYYRVYFKLLDTDVSNISYDELKYQIIKRLQEEDETTNVVFFRLYQKDGKLKGSGNLSVDTIDHLNKLIESKTLSLDDNGKIVFDKFIMTKRVNRKNTFRKFQ